MSDNAPALSGRARRRLVGGLLAAIAVVGVAGGAGMLTGFLPNPVVAGDRKATGLTEPPAPAVQTVKAVRPKVDPNFRLTTTQIATVEPFYQAGLRARVTGVVRLVAKDIGERVRAGELLVEIDVPDLREALAQKEAVIVQRQRELTGAEADLTSAAAAVELARASIRQRDADVAQADNLLAGKRKRFDRFKVLATTQTVTPDVLDEVELEFRAANSAVESAKAAVQKAQAELAEKGAKLAGAQADIDLKKAVVEVARKDRDAAAVQAGYARLYAPFDGVVARRTVDPGMFVQVSAGASSDPLVTVARVDFVTVVAKLPDNAAAYLTDDTQVTAEFDQLPGVAAHGVVTRYAPAIDPADRTLRVELDVFNGTPADYKLALARAAAESALVPLGLAAPLPALAAAGIGSHAVKEDHKGWHEGWAACPDWGNAPDGRRITPGMLGQMRLTLDRFGDARLLPSSAVYTRSGQPYILVVRDGVTRAVPVAVQVNDGRLVKVAPVTAVNGRQVVHQLTGDEVVVVSRQVEIGDGQKVNPLVETW